MVEPLDFSPSAVLATASAFIGHVALGTLTYNQVHARVQQHHRVRQLSWVIIAATAGIPLAWCAYAVMSGTGILLGWSASEHPLFVRLIVGSEQLVSLCAVVGWLLRWLRKPDRGRLTLLGTQTLDLGHPPGQPRLFPGRGPWFLQIPGNQVTQLQITEKQLRLPRLPRELDGLTIAHISDLHFDGKMPRVFFEQVIQQTNALDADLVAVTGDLVDRPSCLDWIDTTLNLLTSRYGRFFVLGNHDTKLGDASRLRQILTEGGAVDLGTRLHGLQIKGRTILLAGNELPWFPQAANATPDESALAAADVSVLLAHTPDQLGWARQQGFDLMLAGHTHGGQIRFPLWGPVIVPSRLGVKYASGTFFEPPTLLHVSRGVSGLFPIRLNCLPEVTLQVLRTD